MWFYNTGLGSKDEVKKVGKKDYSLKTFPSLLRGNNHTNVCIFLYAQLDTAAVT